MCLFWISSAFSAISAVNLRFGFLRFYDFAAAQAGSADADAFGGPVYAGVNRAQINVPAPPRDVVRVADDVSKLRLLAADITNLCHELLQMSSRRRTQRR